MDDGTRAAHLRQPRDGGAWWRLGMLQPMSEPLCVIGVRVLLSACAVLQGG